MTETTFMNNAVAEVFESRRSENRTKNGQNVQKKFVDHKANYENAKEKMKTVISRDGGKFVSFDNEHYGLLVAGVEHQKKLYFMLLDKDRRVDFVPMKETYTWLKEVPGNLSVLYYLYQHERNGLRERVEDWFAENESYTILGEIGIRKFENRGNGSEKKNGNKKNRNKNNKKSDNK